MSKPTLQNNLKIKRHEDNIKFLQTEIKRLSQSILNVQVSLANHHSGNGNGATDENGATRMEEEETEQIMRHERSAAALLCKLKPMKSHHATQALNLTLTQDVLGIVGVVASLGRVDSDDLSRILSEYLGLETMLAIVCRTFECVKVLEKYDKDGMIISSAGIHGLGSSIKNSIKGRFQVLCLEDLRPYVGGFVADNPQRKLALPKPQFPNGECPHGFLDYAVNMINLDKRNLLSLTTAGHGLRETLFYSLFSRLQVYKTRREMLLALPCINDGALSLDGGMIKPSGVFALGSRKNIEVKFLAASGESSMLANYIETEELLKKLKLERTYVTEDMQREQELLDLAKKDLSMIL
ncbi:PREDICTED: protein DEFECTIVE IN MERISTEM SILENCING 3 [Fragaria vesca subsp. vesca]|uniref:protein DEFECTIVE IN MERISTEM SILENCING 3 n=1 Tax=Fragaria vesca subsp. vesca TaxID=101020 RepID=UPI0002C32151|nr:PREDICTED: protein DEFECTIVE IN MERISTEM SILENCING 3 [Fragaria vesca subsp. vesca]